MLNNGVAKPYSPLPFVAAHGAYSIPQVELHLQPYNYHHQLHDGAETQPKA